VILFAVNDTARPITRLLDFSEFGAAGHAVAVCTLRDAKSAGEPDVTNSFAQPERVLPVASQLKASSTSLSYIFPEFSLTVLQWQVGK
jgi:hypothetical protein